MGTETQKTATPTETETRPAMSTAGNGTRMQHGQNEHGRPA